MNHNFHVWFFLVVFYFIIYNNSFVSANSSSSESNSDNVVLACGGDSTHRSDSDGRKWSPDSKLFTSPGGGSTPSTAEFQDPSLPSTVPYMSARFFKSESYYTFAVSKERHWIRLHFYPSSYPIFDPSDAYFSVTVGHFTLLSNFSAYITARALTQAYIIREFSLPPIPSGSLNLTFTPSPGHKNSYAFVNGIEVISMPDIFESDTTIVGFSDQSVNANGSFLQTMFRLNVGGHFIPATNDSGLTRMWYDDSPYLFGAALGVTSQAESNFKVKYTSSVPDFIAPASVYTTSRSMGTDPKLNLKYNLTWVFDVDANFTYIVRFHFCEYLYNKVNERVFNIYINNRTAEASADVIAWAGSEGVPVYKDFAIYVAGRSGDEELRVALHPSSSMMPEYFDSILNGLEIYKVNDTAGNMAGLNPVPSLILNSEEAGDVAPSKSKKFIHTQTLVWSIGVILGLILAAGLFISIREIVRKGLKRGVDLLPLYSCTCNCKAGKPTVGRNITNRAASNFRKFSLADIKDVTQNFDESHVIGFGGYGKVYIGVVGAGTKVAIKRSNPSSGQGVKEFQTEIEMLSKLRHRHLLSLIGYCEENGEMILVYDYMANGTLREHLYSSSNAHMSWKQRLEICIGAAKGLHYLHTGAKHTIIHRDVKTTNILLDENWVAKVSDFGLSKTGPNLSLDQTHVSTEVKGSFGYLDPEYFLRQQLTEKSDVYSFGVVLFEVLCARPAINPSLSQEQVNLADWGRHCQKNAAMEEIVDPCIKEEINMESLKKFSQTAMKCVADHGVDRPSMGDVLWNLEFALQLQSSQPADEVAVPTGQKAETDGYALEKAIFTIEEETISSEGSGHELGSSPVFSLLLDPKGR